MKAKLLLLTLLAGAVSLAAAEPRAETVFTDGEVNRKDGSGKQRSLEIGDKLSTGESVITKKGASAELKLLSGSSSIKIRQNSVFTIGEKDVGGEKLPVLQTIVGSASMKFEKLTAKEPLLGTTTCVAGVRGTEVEIYAGMDGSSVVAVVSGAVQLESAGASVDLAADEAVEVKPNMAPGPKFSWIGKQLDFSAWDKGKLDAYLADPLASALKVEEQLAAYRASMNELIPELAKQKAAYDEAYAKLSELVTAKEDAKAQELRESTVFPLMTAQGTLILNIRYYALTSLSLRRYVLGGMYMEMKTRHPQGASDPALAPFLEAYKRILKDFEAGIVPQLVEADI
jgi:FecR protein